MRYLPLTKGTREEMLQAIGAKDVDKLYSSIPEHIRKGHKFDLPDHVGEIEVESHIRAYANQNVPASRNAFFLGAGCYNHHVPASVDYIIQRSEFLTSYTPYQPEIAQGTLNVIFEFQTYLAKLTGMDVANASMYDGATAASEAALMALRVKAGRKKVKYSPALHPHYKDTVKTYIRYHDGMEVIETVEPCEQTACVIIQTPDFFGRVINLDEIRAKCNKVGALLVVVVNEIVSLGLLPAPVVADIVCGEAQSIGVAMGFGGPHLGFFACKREYVRQMPGRLCGQTVDADGKRSFVLTLNTREQHIRREKATSNICTNQGLMALAFTVHMSLLGEIGFKQLAKINHVNACKLFDEVTKIKGVKALTQNFFNEFAVELPCDSKELVEKLASEHIVAGFAVAPNKLILAATELTRDEDIERLVATFKNKIK